MKQAATLVKGIFITLLFCSLSFFSKAGNGEVVHMPPAFDADHMPGSGALRFTENKGQWQDVVRYRSDFPGGVLFLERKGFSYVLINGNDVRQTHPPKTPMPAGGFIIHEHALKINFENAL